MGKQTLLWIFSFATIEFLKTGYLLFYRLTLNSSVSELLRLYVGDQILLTAQSSNVASSTLVLHWVGQVETRQVVWNHFAWTCVYKPLYPGIKKKKNSKNGTFNKGNNCLKNQLTCLKVMITVQVKVTLRVKIITHNVIIFIKLIVQS